MASVSENIEALQAEIGAQFERLRDREFELASTATKLAHWQATIQKWSDQLALRDEVFRVANDVLDSMGRFIDDPHHPEFHPPADEVESGDCEKIANVTNEADALAAASDAELEAETQADSSAPVVAPRIEEPVDVSDLTAAELHKFHKLSRLSGRDDEEILDQVRSERAKKEARDRSKRGWLQRRSISTD